MGLNNPSGSGTISFGTAAARPAFGTAGRLYWATDTNELTFDTGAAWSEITRLGNGIILDGFSGTTVTAQSGGWAINGNLDINAAGFGVFVHEGSNAKQGTAVLVAGTVTVSNTNTTANSRIFCCGNVAGGTAGAANVSTRTAGTSFTITSTNAADTSTVAFEMFEPG